MNRRDQQTKVHVTNTFTDLTNVGQLSPNWVNIMASDALGVPESSLDEIMNV